MGGFLDREDKRKKSVIGQMIKTNENDIKENDIKENDIKENDIKENDIKENMVTDNEFNNTKDLGVTLIKKEKRTKRLNLLVKETSYLKLEKKCESLEISINECLNQLIEKLIE